MTAHMDKMCSAYLTLYNADYADVLSFLQALSGIELIDPASYRRFQPLIRIYNEPLASIHFLTGSTIPIVQLQPIIQTAIYRYINTWLNNAFCSELSSEVARKHYHACKTLIDPTHRVPQRKAKQAAIASERLDVTVKRGRRDGSRKKSYNLKGKRGQAYLSKSIAEHDVHKLLGIIDQLYHDGSAAAMAECEKLKTSFDAILLHDTHFVYFPRCEFHTRYYGSTLFLMNSVEYWNTYHRSQQTRLFQQAGGRAGSTYRNPCMQDVTGAHAASSHLGNVVTPADLPMYCQALEQDKQISAGSVNIRDHLLHYRLRIAKKVVRYFKQQTTNRQVIHITNPRTHVVKKISRPIIHTDNDYPCIVVHLPITNPFVKRTMTHRFWSQHKRDFQPLAVCALIAFVNTEAVKKKIPIEMVLRSSFGHNLPSACQTGESFRINTGLVPEAYAEVIATALVKTIACFEALNDLNTTIVIDEAFARQVTLHNARKLKQVILKSKHAIFDTLKASPDVQQIETPGCYEKVRAEFDTLKAQHPKIIGRRTGIHIDLIHGMSSWNAIRHKGNTGGNLLIYECFRRNDGAMDWLIDRMMEHIESDLPENPVDIALTQLIKNLDYSGKTVTMKQKPFAFPKHKRFFEHASMKRFYKKDKKFFEIVNMTIKGLGGKTIPNYGLHAELEKFGMSFVIHSRSNATASTESGYGSDSDFEDEYCHQSKKHTIAHKKLRVGNGMSAIIAGHHGALKYLESRGVHEYTQDISSMYFEVEPSLPMVKMSRRLQKLPINADGHLSLLYFDLNCNNSDNSHNRDDLHGMLDRYQPVVIMLDITSATGETTLQCTKQCLSKRSVQLVLLIESGLKHSQAGYDYNPYGEIRIISNEKSTTNQVYRFIIDALTEKDKLGAKAHELVRIFKQRGFARSIHSVFNSHSARHQAVAAFDNSMLTPSIDFSGL